MKKVCILLSGCGHRDGAEIHETTCALLALDRAGVEYVGVAPNHDQLQVTNHINGSSMNEKRNMMIEAGRIMRGNVKAIKEVGTSDFDGLILPGGFGAALNLCNYGVAGRGCEIDSDVRDLIVGFVKAGKSVGAICIAPVVVAKALEGSTIKAMLTIGSDVNVAEDINAMGALHKDCAVDGVVVDKDNKIVSTPAYMLATRISEVETGISKLVSEVLKLM